MFNKPKVKLDMKEEYLIERHPDQDFKKKRMVETLKNQELILVYPNGTSESIKNNFEYTLQDQVKYIYFAKSNKLIHQSNWGTKSRVEIVFDGIKQTLGGYGSIEFKLMNPTRYIERRMSTSMFLTPEMLTELVLAKIPEALVKVVMKLKESEKTDMNSLTVAVKQKLSEELSVTLSEMGIELVDLIITNLNLQELEA